MENGCTFLLQNALETNYERYIYKISIFFLILILWCYAYISAVYGIAFFDKTTDRYSSDAIEWSSFRVMEDQLTPRW